MPKQLNTQKKTQIMNLKVDKESKSATLVLYGDIGDSFWDDISSKEVVQQLDELDVESITININSNGGGTTSAIAIANALKRNKALTVANIDGIVASAATIITSACDIVRMPKNAIFMIHNPWSIAMGEEKDFEKMAKTLSIVKNSIIETYIEKTGLEKEKLSELMDNESWFNSNEAKEYGFVDEIISNTDIETIHKKVIANGMVFNMSKFNNFKVCNQVFGNNVNKENENIKEEIMNKEELKEKYPDVYNEIVETGKELGREEERNRIRELEELGIESEIVNKAKFETPKNINEIALDLVKELKNSNTKIENTTKSDSNVNSDSIQTSNSTNDDYRKKNPPINNTKTEKENPMFMGAGIDSIINIMNKNEEVK